MALETPSQKKDAVRAGRGRLHRLPRARECKSRGRGVSFERAQPSPSSQRPLRSPVKGAERSLLLHFALRSSRLCSLWPGRGRAWDSGTCIFVSVRTAQGSDSDHTAPNPVARKKDAS